MAEEKEKMSSGKIWTYIGGWLVFCWMYSVFVYPRLGSSPDEDFVSKYIKEPLMVSIIGTIIIHIGCVIVNLTRGTPK